MASGDGRQVVQRSKQPCFQAAPSHGRSASTDSGQKRAFVLASQGADDFQVAQGRAIQHHGAVILGHVEVHQGNVGVQHGGEVIHPEACCIKGHRRRIEVKVAQIRHAESSAKTGLASF